MKKLVFNITLEVSDSAEVENFVSDFEDLFCCDCCKSAKIEVEGKEHNFENPDFEEE